MPFPSIQQPIYVFSSLVFVFISHPLCQSSESTPISSPVARNSFFRLHLHAHRSRVLRHDGIGNHQGGHALDDGDGSGHDAGVVTALGGQDTLAVGVVAGRGLVLADGGGGLEGQLEEDGHAVGDAALDAARVVRLGLQARARDARLLGGGVEGRGRDEGVVVLAAVHLGAVEAGADLEALDGGDGEHGVGEEGLELVKGRLAEPRGGVADDAGDGAAGAVVRVAQLGDLVLHAAVGRVVGAAHGEELVDLFAGEVLAKAEEGGVGAHGLGVVKELDVADRGDKGDNLHPIGLLQPLLRDGTGGHARNGLARTTPAAARAGLDAVLLEVGPIRMAGAGVQVDGLVAVVLGALVLVGHGEEDGRAERAAVLDARVDRHAVLFVARRGDGGLAGAATVELGLDVGFGEGDVRGAVVDDARDGLAVGFTRAGKDVRDRNSDSTKAWVMVTLSRGSSVRRRTW